MTTTEQKNKELVSNTDEKKLSPITHIRDETRRYRSITLTFNSKDARDEWVKSEKEISESNPDKRWVYTFTTKDDEDRWSARITMQLNHVEEKDNV